MNRIIKILLLAFLIFNCGENIRENVAMKYNNGQTKVMEYYKVVDKEEELFRIREFYNKDGSLNRKEEN